MLKKWATVISWQQGIAILDCDIQSGCGHCQAQHACNMRVTNKLLSEKPHYLEINIEQPLKPGQRVELGITEGNLLRLAMVMYLFPLVAIILGGALMQWWLATDFGALLGALLGGIIAFKAARRLALCLNKQDNYQLKVLQIGHPRII